jgi:ornithine carbamoyltransferase
MRHFIDLADWSTKELWQIIQLATFLKMEWQTGGTRPVLKNKTLGMIFQKPSLRTRVSFDVAMQHLGGDAIMLGPDEIGLGKRECTGDIARVLSGYVQAIMARVFEHKLVEELAAHASVPVINGLSDAQHPCQSLGDILTIFEHFGRLKGLRMAYIGDGNNVAASLVVAAAHFGIHFTIATPKEYELPARFLVSASKFALTSGSKIEEFNDPRRAVEDADIIYTDTWVSMGQETETEERREAFRPYQINQKLLDHAKGEAVVLHCLPAHRGDEITDEVMDGPQSVIFAQSENRLHIQKAILVKLLGMK